MRGGVGAGNAGGAGGGCPRTGGGSATVGERLDSHLVAVDPHGDRAYADGAFIKTADAGWVTEANAVISRQKGVYVPPAWCEFWRPKRANAKAGTGKAAVAGVGGSSAASFYASNLFTKSWPGVLATNLQSVFGDGGTGLGYWANTASPGAAGSDAYFMSDAGHSYVAGVIKSLLAS